MEKLGLLFLCLLQFSCNSQVQRKINGISFVASREELVDQHLREVLNVNTNHAAIMPYGFIRDTVSPEVIFDTDRQWYGETRKGAMQYIELLHKNGIKTMVKPHIWIWRGEFTGHMKMETEKEWEALENSYELFITTYARMAQEAKSELFCIGTELENFVSHRPEYWNRLIKKIRSVYKGKLTYASNWDEYTRVPFWGQLDYIGIDAYFPLSEEKTPTTSQLRTDWKKHKAKLQKLSELYDKPILFTEFGYRSTNQTAWKPWLVDRHENPVNLEGQANATEAIFEEFWGEEWFAGGYIWKWFIDHNRSGGPEDNRFTPQNKPAQEVVRLYYDRYR